VIYVIDILAGWYRAIIEDERRENWHDRRRRVSAPLSLAAIGEMHEAARDAVFDARGEICDRLVDLGAEPGFHGRAIEVYLGAWWFIAPLCGRADGPLYVHRCYDAAPSEWGDDWLCEEIDTEAPEAARVQVIRDDVTLVLTDGYGLEVYATSRRVEPRELKSRRGR
jgi:hypothetical protein